METEEKKERLREIALIGYQNYFVQPKPENTRMKSFAEWLDMFGLSADDAIPEDEETPANKDAILADVQSIIAADKQRRRGLNHG
jgi:hypothetical protein